MTNNSILSEYKQKIAQLFDYIKVSDEFEFDLNMNKTDITYEGYITLMKYITRIHTIKKLDIERTTTLDITYDRFINNTRIGYRISIIGKDLINQYIGALRNRHNHVIFNGIIRIIRDGKNSKGINILKKIKNFDDTFDIPEFNIRTRLSTETGMTPSELNNFGELDETSSNNITFRYKQRVSLITENTDAHVIRIDLTTTKMASSIKKIDNAIPVYELELEYAPRKIPPKEQRMNIIDGLLAETVILLKVLHRTNHLISKTHAEEVINEYKKLMGLSGKVVYNIDGRQPVSMEIQHATEAVANRYAVVDKADGERCFLIICFGHAYLISQNMKITDTGIIIGSNDYDGSIFDCEYVYIPKYRRHLVLSFDCLFAQNVDIRKNPLLMERISIAHNIIQKCFVLGKQKGYKQKQMKRDNTVDNLVEYHKTELDEYIKVLMNDIEIEKQYPLIRIKYFMPVVGLSDNEVFKYSVVLWNKTIQGTYRYPYPLDGIIYQPLNQQYITNVRESKLSDYKWKPEEKNTIDFYIRFERDHTTGEIVNIFDNSLEGMEVNKPYRVCYLYNGKRTPEGEVPVYFNEENKLYIAHLYLDDGNVRDMNGDILQDETVVEFYYNNKPETGENFRWIPLKTRYDKTEMVNKYKIKYGNSIDIALRIWRSITIPVRASDIYTLADDKMYYKHLSVMRSKITRELLVSASKESLYYQVRTNLAEPMRNFHNWIKSMIIFTYFGLEYNHNKPLTVLDVGCGRGGDLMKFYHAKIASAVCVDVNRENLHNAVDGAISRYMGHRKKYPAFPTMSFVCADFTVPLDATIQMSVSQDKTPANKYLLEKIFSGNNVTKFDRINMQFSFHYFLANADAWKNTCDNINRCLKNGGYILITTFDAQRVLEVLGKEPKYTVYYTVSGEKKILMDIVKKFPDDNTTGLGMAIDVYNSLISNDDVYNTEYLVDKEFITKELKKHCNLELIDTALFDSLYEINRENITYTSTFDENEKTKSFLQTVATYYNQNNEINRECFKITRLNRYYVFRKNENHNINK